MLKFGTGHNFSFSSPWYFEKQAENRLLILILTHNLKGLDLSKLSVKLRPFINTSLQHFELGL